MGLFNQCYWDNWLPIWKMIKSDPYLAVKHMRIPHMRTNSKWIWDPHVKNKPSERWRKTWESYFTTWWQVRFAMTQNLDVVKEKLIILTTQKNLKFLPFECQEMKNLVALKYI